MIESNPASPVCLVGKLPGAENLKPANHQD